MLPHRETVAHALVVLATRMSPVTTFRRPRESGGPRGTAAESAALDARFRGHDG
jgi:hypothetical protein